MAWANSGWVWNVVGTQGSEYNVLLYLSDQADANGVTPPLRIEKILRRCNLNRRSVFVHLKKLEAKGFIKRQRRGGVAGVASGSSVYLLQKDRFFPKGEFSEATGMWVKILLELERTITEEAHGLLRRSAECFLQKNSRVLYLVTDSDQFEETLFNNLAAVKTAAISAKLVYTGKSNRPEPRIRRFEAFRKPYLK